MPGERGRPAAPRIDWHKEVRWADSDFFEMPDLPPGEAPPAYPSKYQYDKRIARWGEADPRYPDDDWVHRGAHVPLELARPRPPSDVDAERDALYARMLAYVGGFSAPPGEPAEALLLRVSPGLGKSFAFVRLAYLLASRRKKVAIAMPRHAHAETLRELASRQGFPCDPDAMYEVRSRYDEERQMCLYPAEHKAWVERGNPGVSFCVDLCKYEFMRSGCPYWAQARRPERIYLIQHQHLALGSVVEGFDVVLVDEDPTQAFLHPWRIPAEAVCPPEAPEGNPVTEILRRLARHAARGNRLEGPELLDLLGGPQAVVDAAYRVRTDETRAFVRQQLSSEKDALEAPYGHLFDLLRLLEREARLARDGKPYPHRVLVRKGALELLLRRNLSGAFTNVPMVIADATAEPRVLGACLGRPLQVARCDVAPAGRVVQVTGRNNGKVALFGKSKKEPKAQALEDVREQLRAIRRRHSGERLGAITWKDLAPHLADLADVVGHFFAERGSNEFEDCGVLAVVGTPNPPIGTVLDQAKMVFFKRDQPFEVGEDGDPRGHEEVRPFRHLGPDGFCPAAVVTAFDDPDLRAVHWSLREAEVVQAAHRARIATRPATVYLLTGLPVDELRPDAVLSIPELMGAPPGVDAFAWAAGVLPYVVYCEQQGHPITQAGLAETLGDTHRNTLGSYWRRLEPHLLAQGWRSGTVPSGGRGRPAKALFPPPGEVL